MGKEWLFLYDRGNLLVWCHWWGAQTSDAVKNSAGVSRAGRFCISSPVLQTFIHVSYPIIPLSHCLSNQKGTSDLTIEDLLDWSWLDYRIYLESLIEIYTQSGNKKNDGVAGWSRTYSQTHLPNTDWILPIWTVIFVRVRQERDYWSLPLDKKKSWQNHCWGNVSQINISNMSMIKTVSWKPWCVMKENKILSSLYQLFTEELRRKHKRVCAYSGSQGRASGIWWFFQP